MGVGSESESQGQSEEYGDGRPSDLSKLTQVIMPLVFFISGADPRFTSTLDAILKT
jgi:hypothetical protein